MRLTFFVARVASHCPTVSQMVTALNHPSSQFSVVDVTSATSDRIRQALQESDAILVEATILGASKNPSLFPHYLQLARPLNAAQLQGIVEQLLEPDLPRLLVAGDFDLHGPLGGGLTPKQASRFDALAWDYVEVPPGVETVPDDLVDEWMSEQPLAFANWLRIREDFACQIEFPHAVATTDVVARRSIPIWDTCVPGQPYASRQVAASSARIEGLSQAPFALAGRAIFKLTKPLGSLGVTGDAARYRVQALNQRFNVAHSRACWVDGSAYGYFVRKFVEVPALGTPMVSPHMPMLSRLGFETGKAYVEAEPAAFGHEARFLRDNPRIAQSMGRAAQQVVKKHHLWSHRLSDLHTAARSVVEGDRRVWRYEQGTLQPCSD